MAVAVAVAASHLHDHAEGEDGEGDYHHDHRHEREHRRPRHVDLGALPRLHHQREVAVGVVDEPLARVVEAAPLLHRPLRVLARPVLRVHLVLLPLLLRRRPEPVVVRSEELGPWLLLLLEVLDVPFVREHRRLPLPHLRLQRRPHRDDHRVQRRDHRRRRLPRGAGRVVAGVGDDPRDHRHPHQPHQRRRVVLEPREVEAHLARGAGRARGVSVKRRGSGTAPPPPRTPSRGHAGTFSPK